MVTDNKSHPEATKLTVLYVSIVENRIKWTRNYNKHKHLYQQFIGI